MNNIFKASYSTLNQSKKLLLNLSNATLCNKSVSPYYSSIGSHLRHILDFYKCVFDGLDNGLVDLTIRERKIEVEEDCTCANDYLDGILNKLLNNSFNTNEIVTVIDDLGEGKIKIDYTVGGLLSQANSHTIHHYAIINYILDRLGIEIANSRFGFNPTSPKPELNSN